MQEGLEKGVMAGLPPPPSHSHLPKVSLGFLTAWRPQQGSQHDCPADKEQLSEEEARDPVSDIASRLPHPMNQNRSCPRVSHDQEEET